MVMYPVPTLHRMPWDVDGSVVVRDDAGSLSTPSAAFMNSESWSTYLPVGNPYSCLVLIFPEVRSVSGFFLGASGINSASFLTFQYSLDTTNGHDGTWTSTGVVPVVQNVTTDRTYYRSRIQTVSVTQAKAVRVQAGNFFPLNIMQFHVYGSVYSGNPDRLELWDASGTTRMSPGSWDFGDMARSASSDVLFRVKNLSPSLSATSVVVSVGAATDPSPSFASEFLLSPDGVTFTSSVNVGTIAPGATSSQVTLRRVSSSTSALGPWAGRVTAIPAAMV